MVQQRALRVQVVEVLEDRQRLRERPLLGLEHGQQALGVDLAEVPRQVRPGAQVHGDGGQGQALERRADAHAVARRGPPVVSQDQPGGGSRGGPGSGLVGGAGAQEAGSVIATVCSMLPKMVAPSSSSISMRTRSPWDMKGVVALPLRMVSMQRSSAMQQ